MAKRILYVNPTAVHGGAEEVLLRVMIYSRDLGYDPVLIVPAAGWLTEQCSRCNIPVEILPVIPDTFVTYHFHQQFAPWLPSALGIVQLVKKWSASLVHSNTPRVSYHGGLGARLARIPAVTHVHDLSGLPYASAPQARLLSSLSDWILVPSQAVREAIVSYAPWLGPRVQTLYNGWDVAEYDGVQPANLHTTFGVPETSVVIGNVAAMHPWKGQDVVIAAFQLLHARVPQTHLVLVGGAQGSKYQSEYESQIRQKVVRAGLDHAVTFTGWREDVWPLIASFDVFVHAPTQPDPLPTSVLHACALRRAVVASRIGGIPEIVPEGRGGLLVPPGDPEALSVAIESLIMHPSLRSALGEQAHAHFIQRFSREQMIAGLAEAYQRCLGGSE